MHGGAHDDAIRNGGSDGLDVGCACAQHKTHTHTHTHTHAHTHTSTHARTQPSGGESRQRLLGIFYYVYPCYLFIIYYLLFIRHIRYSHPHRHPSDDGRMVMMMVVVMMMMMMMHIISI
mmetsp:Transcript_26187/g.48825  ORF Transcript_26187/g.48825 Transcript_26187/m.48825 type:complete len:119 (+) Transcript_26187:313-669(+)